MTSLTNLSKYIWILIVYILIFVCLWIFQDPILLGMEWWQVPPFYVSLSLFFGGILLFFSFIFIYSFYRDYIVGKDSLTWPSVEGEIIASEIFDDGVDEDGHRHFGTNIIYSYSVEGRNYVSNQITVSEPITHIHHTTHGYPVKPGKKVVVHYNPRKPEGKILSFGNKIRSFIWLDGKHIKAKFTVNAKIGNAVLRPGLTYSINQIRGGIILGIILAVLGELLWFVALFPV